LSGKKKLEKRSPILRLGITDRIALFNILPRKGALLTLQVADEIRKRAVISAEEQKRIKYRESFTPDGKLIVEWDVKKESPLDLQLTPFEADLLKKTVNYLDNQEEIVEEWRALCEKIKKL